MANYVIDLINGEEFEVNNCVYTIDPDSNLIFLDFNDSRPLGAINKNHWVCISEEHDEPTNSEATSE